MTYLDKAARALERIREERRYRELPERQLPPDIIDFSSNDYLAMAKEPQVVQALKHATRAGSGGARLLAGRNRELSLLEEELAQWLGRERALLFSSGYTAAIGTIPCSLSSPAPLLPIAESRIAHRRHASDEEAALQSTTTLRRRNGGTGQRAGCQRNAFRHGRRRVDVGALVSRLRDDDIFLLDEAHALGVAG